MSHLQSSGRGGAGNIVDSSKTQQLHPEDLQTPTLKTSMVTTGRGGTGNFASGLDAEEKRRRQDVVPVVRRDSHSATHIGRGGTGNVVKASSPTGETSDVPSPTPSPNPAGPAGSPSPVAGTSASTLDKPPSPTTTGAGANAITATMDKLRRERSRASTGGGNDDDVAVPARKPEEMGWAERGMNLLFGKR